MPVRPCTRHCQRGFAVRRFPPGLLLRGLSGVRAVSRSRGHTRRRRRNGHFPDADGSNHAYRGHGSCALRAAIRQGVSLVRQLLPDSDREHRRSTLSACRSHSFFYEPSARHSFPRRGTRAASLPHLRTFLRWAASAKCTATAVARRLRPSLIETSRLVAARTWQTKSFLRRAHWGSALHASHPLGGRTR
jgi:hypothetical protein